MAIDPDDREVYEAGQKRRNDPIYGAINDLGETIFGSSRSESEEEALRKGERGEQLDE